MAKILPQVLSLESWRTVCSKSNKEDSPRSVYVSGLSKNAPWILHITVDRISGSKLAVDSLKFDYNTGGILSESPRKLSPQKLQVVLSI
jgi:hypothetical protein